MATNGEQASQVTQAWNSELGTIIFVYKAPGINGHYKYVQSAVGRLIPLKLAIVKFVAIYGTYTNR